MDIQSRSAEYLHRIISSRHKLNSLYEMEVYFVLLCVIAVTFYLFLRGGLLVTYDNFTSC